MKDIIMNISMLEGFISKEELSGDLRFADLSGQEPLVCSKYSGPHDGGNDLEDDNGYQRGYC